MAKKNKKKKNYINNKKFKKKQKKERNEYIQKFKDTIIAHKDSIWRPKLNVKYENIKTDSCFDILNHTSNNNSNTIHDIKTNNIFPEEMKKCFKVKIYPNELQKTILFKWFDAYIDMYNATLSLIKDNYKNGNKAILNYKKLRTEYLKDIKCKISGKSQMEDNNYNTKIVSHSLDAAIKLACANYKSAFSNYKSGRMKKLFRVRYWKKNKPTKIVCIEPSYINQNSICHKIFGKFEVEDIEINNKKFELNDIKQIYKSEFRMLYDKDTNEFVLHIPCTIKPKKKTTIIKENMVSLDPGIRTFMTGISDNSTIKIGTNISGKIKQKLNRLDKIKGNDKISTKIKKKNEEIINRKISNMVDEMHWKTLNYLTNKYKNILIGDMSVKGIINNETSKLSKMTKRIGNALKFYQFRERLKFKCNMYKIGHKIVDEKYTTKMCSNCGHIDNYLGASKIYKCKQCGMEIDRDVNGSRCIYIKGNYM